MATILIGGGTDLIGKHLSHLLAGQGHEVLHLSRGRQADAEFPVFHWDVEKGLIDEEAVQRSDYVINLAGAGIADKPWTSERKRVIIDSRVNSIRLLLATFQRLGKRPRAFLSSAGIGYYGDRGELLLHETAGPGDGFLSESCLAWEGAVDEVMRSGIRTIALRLGIVLSVQGGALPKMSMPIRFLAAPYFGNGRQWYSWIHIDDACRAFVYGMENESMSGKYNAAAPQPVRNKEFMKTIADAMGKPALLTPAPAFAMRLALGEMAHTVLDSTRVSPEKLLQTGFNFNFPELRTALEDVLDREL